MPDETKRISFDREGTIEVASTVLELIVDPERILEGWERIYTCPSIRDADHAPAKLRFGTGDQKKQKWHIEEPTPAVDVVYTVCTEVHCRDQDVGVFGVYGAGQSDKVTVVWHGYDKRIRER